MKCRITHTMNGQPVRKVSKLTKPQIERMYIGCLTEFAQIALVSSCGWGARSIAGRKLKIDRFAVEAEKQYAYYRDSFKGEPDGTITNVITSRMQSYGISIAYDQQRHDSYKNRLLDVISLSFLETLTAQFNFGVDDIFKFFYAYKSELDDAITLFKTGKKSFVDYIDGRRDELHMVKPERNYLGG